ncbi:MAG: LytR/AlgR family response regulator transcription factor [Saprospiraceae bacterium]
MKLNCLIIDDEPLSRKVIKNYLTNISFLELKGECSNAFDAIEFLQKETVDLLFLDINMPKLNGINFLKSLPNPPLVIFITAYPEYAVEGFELDAVDYLLKPFSLDRFLKAVYKAQKIKAQVVKLEQLNQQPSTTDELSPIMIKSDKKWYKLAPEQIKYLQAYGDYVKVFTADKTLLTKDTLGNLEQSLPASLFQRIHRSYIVALDAINFIEGNQADIQGQLLPIAITHKEALMSRWRGPEA